MQVKLRGMEGTDRGREIKIRTPQCIVGRGRVCDVRLVNPAVSQRHCAILVLGRDAFVQNLSSYV